MELPSLFFTAGVLRNFAAADLLLVCQMHCRFVRAKPCWTESTFRAIDAGYRSGDVPCGGIIEAGWLTAPVAIEDEHHLGVYRMKVVLNHLQVPACQLPERTANAETLYMAGQCKGTVATDDAAALDLFRARWGEDRAIDTIQLLRSAIFMRLLGPAEAARAVEVITTTGGSLKYRDPTHIDVAFFGG